MRLIRYNYRPDIILSLFSLFVVGSEAFLAPPSFSGSLLSSVYAKDADATDSDTKTEELPFLALPGAGGSSFDPLSSENRFGPMAQEGKDLKAAKFVSDKFELQYTCKRCDTRNNNKVSRIAYRNGVVIVVCKGCMAKHLIADNLGWHNYIGGFEGEPDIEAYLASQGREGDVNRVSADVFELEQRLEKTPPSSPSTEHDGDFGGVADME